MSWFSEYKKSLKDIDAEEPLDIYFFRPLAFIIVKIFYRLPLTPNHYSLLAFLSGCVSAGHFLQGNLEHSIWGAFYFLLFAIFDCCDGMVARLKKNGTEFGRLIDGVVDYLVNIVVYIALGIGANKAYGPIMGISVGVLVILAGASKALHSIIYDHYLMEYLAHAKGDGGFAQLEIKILEDKIQKSKTDNSSFLRKAALRVYLTYSLLQVGRNERILRFNPKSYCLKNLKLLKMWSLIGPATHITFLILAFLLQQPIILFVFAIVFGNLWLAFMFMYQQQVRLKLSRESVA
jgi:CDP-alcohol phosphatidyltransferase